MEREGRRMTDYDYEYDITSVSNLQSELKVVVLEHVDGTFTEVVFSPTGIGMWYKDAEYAQINFVDLEKVYKGEEE